MAKSLFRSVEAELFKQSLGSAIDQNPKPWTFEPSQTTICKFLELICVLYNEREWIE